MANHVSAKKRSRQNKNKNAVNSQYLSKFRTAKALKKGIFKKENISRKLSSLSKQIQKN